MIDMDGVGQREIGSLIGYRMQLKMAYALDQWPTKLFKKGHGRIVTLRLEKNSSKRIFDVLELVDRGQRYAKEKIT